MSENIARNIYSSRGTINYPTLLHLFGHFLISWCTEPWISWWSKFALHYLLILRVLEVFMLFCHLLVKDLWHFPVRTGDTVSVSARTTDAACRSTTLHCPVAEPLCLPCNSFVFCRLTFTASRCTPAAAAAAAACKTRIEAHLGWQFNYTDGCPLLTICSSVSSLRMRSATAVKSPLTNVYVFSYYIWVLC